VGERNRREGKKAINVTCIQRTHKQANLMSRKSYERDEDWLVTCPVCHGTGTTGEGASRKRCPKCDGAGKLKR
jgi:DnaJ-class molecular chaperone